MSRPASEVRPASRLLVAVLGLASGGLVACAGVPGMGVPAALAPAAETTAASAAPAIRGVVEFGPRGPLANLAQVASGATVAVLDAGGKAVAAAVTTESGQFSLSFSSRWVPTPDRVYVLEAAKALGPNRVGQPLLRVRTLLHYQSGSWVTATQGMFVVNRATTALAVLASLKGLSTEVATADFLGVLDLQGKAVRPASSYTQEELDTVTGLVSDALAADQDPVGAIVLAGGRYYRVPLAASLPAAP